MIYQWWKKTTVGTIRLLRQIRNDHKKSTTKHNGRVPLIAAWNFKSKQPCGTLSNSLRKSTKLTSMEFPVAFTLPSLCQRDAKLTNMTSTFKTLNAVGRGDDYLLFDCWHIGQNVSWSFFKLIRLRFLEWNTDVPRTQIVLMTGMSRLSMLSSPISAL